MALRTRTRNALPQPGEPTWDIDTGPATTAGPVFISGGALARSQHGVKPFDQGVNLEPAELCEGHAGGGVGLDCAL